MASQHIILRIVNGRTQLPTRSFTRGEPVPQFSVGSRGDWIVSAPGVASFHVLLMFDGEHVFAASADPAAAPVYLGSTPIGNTWHPVTSATELRFGEARLVVAREASLAPPAGASPPRPPKPEARDVPLPPVTVRQAPQTAKHTGPGNTQFFDNLKAQVEQQTGSAPPPPAAGPDALMAAVAPTLARQPPTTFPMQPPVAPASPSLALQATALPLPTGPQPQHSTGPQPKYSTGPQPQHSTGPQPSTTFPPSAPPPPMISSPAPWQPVPAAESAPWQPVPPPVPAVESMPTAFSPQFPGDMPPAPRLSPPPPSESSAAPMPAGGLPTLASQSQPPTPGWGGRGLMELPTHFAPAGSIALPPEAAPTAIAPTDDGAPLPLGMPFAVPPLPMPPNAEGEPYSTIAADADAIRNFAAHLPPNPPDPQFPPGGGSYPPPPQMQSQTPFPPAADGGYLPTYFENQTPPPHAPAPRFSQNPRAKQSERSKWLLIVVLPLTFAIVLVVLAFLLIAR